jgi:hypothetical protein
LRLCTLGSWFCTSLALALSVVAALAVPEGAFADSGDPLACGTCSGDCAGQCGGTGNACYENCMTNCLGSCCGQQCGTDPGCWSLCCRNACMGDPTCLANCQAQEGCDRTLCETPNCNLPPCPGDITGCNKTPGSCNPCKCVKVDSGNCECHAR